MVTDINLTYYVDHFAIYSNIELLYHTPENNIMLHINFTLIKIIKWNRYRFKIRLKSRSMFPVSFITQGLEINTVMLN